MTYTVEVVIEAEDTDASTVYTVGADLVDLVKPQDVQIAILNLLHKYSSATEHSITFHPEFKADGVFGPRWIQLGEN